jgi:hypothetical protein
VLQHVTAAGLSLLVPGSLSLTAREPHPRPSGNDFAENALRLDLRHDFVSGVERFTLRRLRVEQQWPGNNKRQATPAGWGDFRLSVYDRQDRSLLFRSGFDSNLDLGAGSVATELSVRCPAPLRPIDIAVEKRLAENLFHERWTVAIDPNDARIDRSGASIAARVEAIRSNGTHATKVNIAILGDGYQASEYQKFIDDAARAAGYLFSVEPFRRRARDFNVNAVFAPSTDSGVTDPYLSMQRNTVLGCAYYTGELERTLTARDNHAVRELASAVPYDFLLILANARRYGGSATFGGPAVVAIDSAAAAYLVIHEFAHVIGGLADEYYVPNAEGPTVLGNIEPWNPNVTISPDKGKWRDRSTEQAPQPTQWNKSEYERYFSRYVKRYFALRSAHVDESVLEKFMAKAGEQAAALLAKNGPEGKVGWFEGANGYARGAFRAQVDCIMFSFQTRYFCRACSSAIERMIDEHCS